MIATAKRAGVRSVLLIGPLPEFPMHPPDCLVRTIRTGIDACATDRTAIDARRAGTMEVLDRVTDGIKDVRIIDPINLFYTTEMCHPHVGRTL